MTAQEEAQRAIIRRIRAETEVYEVPPWIKAEEEREGKNAETTEA